MKNFILLLLLILSHAGLAQTANVLDNNVPEQNLTSIAALTDHGYTIEQVSTSTTLPFVVKDSVVNASSYWLKVILYNPADHHQSFDVKIYPNWNNTFYYYNHLSKRWLNHKSGIESNITPWLLTTGPYDLAGHQTDTVYINMQVNTAHHAFKPAISLIPDDLTKKNEQDTYTLWLVGTLILFLFFLNNLYILISFKDKAVWYYLVVQLGGMAYLTSYWFYFDQLFTYRIFSFILTNHYYAYTLNGLFMHIAIVVIFYGFIQLTRSYLNTKITLSSYDKLLKYGFFAYVIFSVVIAIINLSGFYIEYHSLIYDNIFCLVLILIVSLTSIISYKRGLPTAGSFLLANILPLFFMCCIALYHIFAKTSGSHNYWFPVMVAVSQALGFSTALVTRTKAIRDTLAAKEIESRRLEFNLKEVAYQNQLKENEIQQYDADIKLQTYQNELLQLKLESSQRELVSSNVYLHQKTKLLTELGTHIQDIGKMYPDAKNPALSSIQSTLKDGKHLDEEWDKFKLHFEQVHPKFFDDLKATYPKLTNYDMRLYAYFHINLSTKEIATLLNIVPTSVKQAKARLNKKMKG